MSCAPRLEDLRWIVSALCAALLSSTTWAITVEVAPSGVDDPGCGDLASPCASLDFALGAVTGPGDTVHLASGTYLLTDPVVVTKSGEEGNQLVIDGSGAGTVLNGALLVGNPIGVTLIGDYVTLRDLTITGVGGTQLGIEGTGVTVINATLSQPASNNRACIEVTGAQTIQVRNSTIQGCTAEGIAVTSSAAVTVRNSSVQGAAGAAIFAQDVSDLTLEGVVLAGNGISVSSAAIELVRCAGFQLRGFPRALPSTILGHPGPAVSIQDSSDGVLRNTIISGTEGGVVISQGGAATALVLDAFHLTVTGTSAAPVFTDDAAGTSLSVRNSIFAFNPAGDLAVAHATHHHNLRHQNGGGALPLDPTELDADPLFIDAAADDYHLMSEHGRYSAGAWVSDGATSQAIDLGDPADAYSRETPLNGDRANAGAYGNTEEASRSASGTAPDAGAGTDAARPDSSLPDAALPDLALPDGVSADAGVVDSAGADLAVGMDAVSVDLQSGDVTSSDDSAAPDSATRDGGGGVDQVDPDGDGGGDSGGDSGGAAVVARAGLDQLAEVPAIVTLDGSDSTAPVGATFLWTVSDSPSGPRSEPLGTDPVARAAIDAEGIWVFQLTVSADGVSDSDLIEVRALGEEQALAEGCGCRALAASSAPVRLSCGLLVWVLLRRGRARNG